MTQIFVVPLTFFFFFFCFLPFTKNFKRKIKNVSFSHLSWTLPLPWPVHELSVNDNVARNINFHWLARWNSDFFLGKDLESLFAHLSFFSFFSFFFFKGLPLSWVEKLFKKNYYICNIFKIFLQKILDGKLLLVLI